MTRLTGGQALVKSVIAGGVDTLFALPGVQLDHFFNALHDEGNAIRVINSRHEQGAGYMALGQAMATGGIGAYAVVPGPGVLNTLSALATAQSAGARVPGCFASPARYPPSISAGASACCTRCRTSSRRSVASPNGPIASIIQRARRPPPPRPSASCWAARRARWRLKWRSTCLPTQARWVRCLNSSPWRRPRSTKTRWRGPRGCWVTRGRP